MEFKEEQGHQGALREEKRRKRAGSCNIIAGKGWAQKGPANFFIRQRPARV